MKYFKVTSSYLVYANKYQSYHPEWHYLTPILISMINLYFSTDRSK